MSNRLCPVCGMHTVPGLTCPCPPVRTPAALAALLERQAEAEHSELVARDLADQDRTERGGERDESPLETCEDDDLVML